MADRYDPKTLLAYIEDELPPDQRRALERELAGDEKLQALVSRIKADRDALRDLPRQPAPPHVLEEVTGQLERHMLLGASHDSQSSGGRSPGRRSMRLFRSLTAAAAVAVVGVCAWVIVTTLTSTRGLQVAREWQAVAPATQNQARANQPLALLDRRAKTTAGAAGKVAVAGAPTDGVTQNKTELGSIDKSVAEAPSSATAKAATGFVAEARSKSVGVAGPVVVPAAQVLHIETADPDAARRAIVQWVQAHGAAVDRGRGRPGSVAGAPSGSVRMAIVLPTEQIADLVDAVKADPTCTAVLKPVQAELASNDGDVTATNTTKAANASNDSEHNAVNRKFAFDQTMNQELAKQFGLIGPYPDARVPKMNFPSPSATQPAAQMRLAGEGAAARHPLNEGSAIAGTQPSAPLAHFDWAAALRPQLPLAPTTPLPQSAPRVRLSVVIVTVPHASTMP